MAVSVNYSKERNSVLRIISFCIYIISTIVAIALIYTLWRGFLTNPTMTSLESSYFPVNRIPFPSVAICNVNKISKKKALLFSQKTANYTKMDVAYVFNLTKLFGKLYDFDYDNFEDGRLKELEQIVEVLGLNVISLMKQLTTNCEDLLVQCSWNGFETNCSKIFKLRLTYDGYCCTFNYVKKTRLFTPDQTMKEPRKGEHGVDKGLSVTINNEIDDYFYTTLETQGVTVQVFVPTDYPDKPSGSLSELVAKVGTENFLEINPTTIRTSREVKKYSLDQRVCLFDEERLTQFDGTYSQSDCNVDCRAASVFALCQCIPFMIPLSTVESVCTLHNLKCLNHYRRKWYTVYPENDEMNVLQHEQHDSLRCHQKCYPSCDETLYDVYIDSATIHKNGNQTIIHIYYMNKYSNIYKQDVIYYWFEMLSNFGGTFGIILGFSVISIIECIMFSFKFLRKKLLYS